jgi:Fe-S cluster assembly protein SufD
MLPVDAEAFRRAHDRHRAALPPGWPLSASVEALEALLARGLPDTRTESWRYTSLADFAARLAEGLGKPSAGAGPEPALARTPLAGVNLTLRDGHRIDEPGAGGSLPAGIGIAPAAAALEPLTSSTSPLVDLNTAFARDGLALRVAPGLQQPLVIRDRAVDGLAITQPRVGVTLSAGSRATLVQLATDADRACANAVTRIIAEPDSELELFRLHDAGSDARRLDRIDIELQANARVRITVVDAGGPLSRQDLTVRLVGSGATLDLAGLAIGRRAAHVDHQITIEHSARQTRSRIQYRCVADAGGRAVFNGRIVVSPGAAGTDAALTNRNLLLQAGAEINTKPELEIYTDDVKCSHGATTGQLDAAALFYLQSRGVAAAEARRLLIAAFVAEVLGRIGDATLSAAMADRLRAVLETT